jgi:sRNA-binding regulator protein Hfq
VKRIPTTLFLALAIFLCPLGPAARAQQLDQTAKVKAEVTNRLNKKEGHVKVKLRNGSEVKGHITQTSENGFTVADEKTRSRTDIAYADVQNVEGRGMSKTKKVLIGVGIGVAVFAGMVAYALTHFWD